MKFSVLSSSSSGNATIIENNGKYYLLDSGIGIRSFYNKLNQIGIYVDKISAIFITHEHNDHISGLVSIANKFKSRIYMTKETYKALPFDLKEKISPINFSFINIGNEFIVDDLAINTFNVYHDATDPIGYVIKDNISGKTLTYITDTGKMEPFELIKNSDAYILESNHEPDLLLMSARPWILKNRIMSEEGHLSNEDSAILFSKIFGDKTRNVMLFHLSNECNTHELALSTYLRYFKKNGIDISNIKISISNQSTPTEIIEV